VAVGVASRPIVLGNSRVLFERGPRSHEQDLTSPTASSRRGNGRLRGDNTRRTASYYDRHFHSQTRPRAPKRSGQAALRPGSYGVLHPDPGNQGKPWIFRSAPAAGATFWKSTAPPRATSRPFKAYSPTAGSREPCLSRSAPRTRLVPPTILKTSTTRPRRSSPSPGSIPSGTFMSATIPFPCGRTATITSRCGSKKST
jgi:hypothetical protein